MRRRDKAFAFVRRRAKELSSALPRPKTRPIARSEFRAFDRVRAFDRAKQHLARSRKDSYGR